MPIRNEWRSPRKSKRVQARPSTSKRETQTNWVVLVREEHTLPNRLSDFGSPNCLNDRTASSQIGDAVKGSQERLGNGRTTLGNNSREQLENSSRTAREQLANSSRTARKRLAAQEQTADIALVAHSIAFNRFSRDWLAAPLAVTGDLAHSGKCERAKVPSLVCNGHSPAPLGSSPTGRPKESSCRMLNELSPIERCGYWWCSHWQRSHWLCSRCRCSDSLVTRLS